MFIVPTNIAIIMVLLFIFVILPRTLFKLFFISMFLLQALEADMQGCNHDATLQLELTY